MLTYTKLKNEDLFNISQAENDNTELLNQVLQKIDLGNTDARTYHNENGDIIFVGGLVESWKYTSVVWSVLSKDSGKHMRQITKEVIAWIDTYKPKYRRIEFHVDVAFKAGNRWAKMLGFELDGTLRRYLANGNDANIYSIINYDI